MKFVYKVCLNGYEYGGVGVEDGGQKCGVKGDDMGEFYGCFEMI